MSKPRFPLSVTRTFVYRAFIRETGELLESADFKTLFMRTRSHLRTESLYKEEDFKSTSATIEFGYSTYYEERPGYGYEEWTMIKYYGFMYVSTLSESYYRTEDGASCVMRGKYDI